MDIEPSGGSPSVASLSPDGLTAVAVRCALRVLPAYDVRDLPAEPRRDALLAAGVGLLAVLYGAIQGRERYAGQYDRTLSLLQSAGADDDPAGRCITAAMIASGSKGGDVETTARRAIQSHGEIARSHEADEAFASAFEHDVVRFTTERSKYFSRPLFERVPEPWQRVVDEWRLAMDQLGLRELRHWYDHMLTGAVAPELDIPPVIGAVWPEEKAAGSAPRPPDVWMLSDRPLDDRFSDQDRFQFQDYADALAAILDHPSTGTPFTMAINAPWGAGKTTLANMIAEQLRTRPRLEGRVPHIICRFNAWMHDDAPNAVAPLIAEVSRAANPHRFWPWRIINPLPFALRTPTGRTTIRASYAAVALVVAVLAMMWLAPHLQEIEARKRAVAAWDVTTDAQGRITHVESRTVKPPPDPVGAAAEPHQVDEILETVQSRVVVLGGFFTALAGIFGLLVRVGSTPLGRFVESPNRAAEAGAIVSAHAQLRRLIRQATWRGNHFVIFIDDIERCRPDRAIDVVNALNQLLDHERVIVVLLGDMAAVAAAAQLKYRDLAEIFVPSAGIATSGADRGKEAFGRLYLQKIVQFQFDLPIPPKKEIEAYLRKLALPGR